jgi:hypothetical protein
MIDRGAFPIFKELDGGEELFFIPNINVKDFL